MELIEKTAVEHLIKLNLDIQKRAEALLEVVREQKALNAYLQGMIDARS